MQIFFDQESMENMPTQIIEKILLAHVSHIDDTHFKVVEIVQSSLKDLAILFGN
jgi:hypothetical protein